MIDPQHRSYMAVEATTVPSAIDPTRTQLAGTIRQASTATGVSFDYLVAAAKIESNLNPNAAAPTSSARGLYQFIEQTWLGTVKEAGSAFGYDRYADAITRTSSGRYEVSDPAMRRDILALRKDPAANAAMAGVLTRSNSLTPASPSFGWICSQSPWITSECLACTSMP